MPRANRRDRATRVKLQGTVLALVRLENGRNIRARLHQLSVTGGLLSLSKPLDESIKVELIFHVGSATVRSHARPLFPMWATRGYLQPFRFTDLAGEERAKLERNLKSFVASSRAGSPIGDSL
jgi:hypothetical protein